MTLEDFLKEWYAPEDVLLVHTSGSTGKPKPMYVEKQKMLNSARITCNFLGLQKGDRALLCMPLDYIAGKMVVVRSIERKLQLISVRPSGHPLASLSEEDQEKPIDFAAMVLMQVYNSLQVDEERAKLREIRHLIIGGGAIDDALQAELSDFPNAVWSTYGMTETLSHIALRRLNGSEASDWYRPFESVHVRTNADGCLVIDAPQVHAGELETHDRVELRTCDGHTEFRILGRIDNVIDSGGIKIQIEEVESKLAPHLVQPYIITKKTDGKFGEIVVLLTEDTDIEHVKTVCEAVLPKYWQPRLYRHIHKVPLTETGKPARGEALRFVKGL